MERVCTSSFVQNSLDMYCTLPKPRPLTVTYVILDDDIVCMYIYIYRND